MFSTFLKQLRVCSSIEPTVGAAGLLKETPYFFNLWVTLKQGLVDLLK